MAKYCSDCGSKEITLKIDEFNTKTGKQLTVKECMNPDCLLGKFNSKAYYCRMSGGHTFRFFSSNCQKCDYSMPLMI